VAEERFLLLAVAAAHDRAGGVYREHGRSAHAWRVMRLPDAEHLGSAFLPPSTSGNNVAQRQAEPITKQQWGLIALTLALGFGSHSISHALAPVEPLLADLGLSPICYALLTLTPHIGQFLTPPFWGWAFAVRMRLALVVAPVALVAGQSLVALGLLAIKLSMPWVAALLLLLGVVLSSCSKAGLSVLQHSCLALLLPPSERPAALTPSAGKSYQMYEPSEPSSCGALSAVCGMSAAPNARLVTGLCLSVGTTHVIGAAMMFLVPLITQTSGLVGLQFFLILPALASALSGYVLGALLPQPEPAPAARSPEPRRRAEERTAFAVLCVSCGTIVRRPHPFQTTCDKCKEAAAIQRLQQRAVLALGLWRSTLISTFLHGFSTVVVGLLVSHEFSMVEAGRLVSLASVLSLLLLPALMVWADQMPRLLGVVTLAVLASACLVVVAQEMGGEFAPWSLASKKPGHDSSDSGWPSMGDGGFDGHVRGGHTVSGHVSGVALAASTGMLAPTGGAALAPLVYAGVGQVAAVSAAATTATATAAAAATTATATTATAAAAAAAAAAITTSATAAPSAARALEAMIPPTDSTKGTPPPEGTEGAARRDLPVVLWWLPRIGVVCMALCSGVAPVLPLALVPIVLPPAQVGASVGKAYGQLDMCSAIGQALGSLALGWARQTGGFQFALRFILGGIVLTLPTTIYAQRSTRAAVAALHRVAQGSHQSLPEVGESPMSAAATCAALIKGSRIRPQARLFMVREA
jgi:hypothetical protein